jgi:hypothetical protein
MIQVALLLLAAATHVDLVDEVFQIPAGQWRYVDLGLRQKPPIVAADFEVRSGSHEVQLALMRRDDLEKLRQDRPHGLLAETETAGSGRLRYQVRVAGDYALLIDNREGRRPASVHLRVNLDWPIVTRLSLPRQITVITISFAVFFAIAGFSARRLLRGMKH